MKVYKYGSIYTLIPTISVCRFTFFTEIHLEFWRWVVVFNLKKLWSRFVNVAMLG